MGRADRLAVLLDHRGELAAVDVPLEQHLVVVGERVHERGGHVVGRARELDAERGPLRGRLHHDREGQPLLDLRQRLGRASSRKASSLNAKNSGVGTPASMSRCLASTLSMQRMHASTPGPVYGMPRISSSSWTVPSSPLRPCSARNATSGRRLRRLLDQVGPDVDRKRLVPQALERLLDARRRSGATPGARASCRP